jgi:hypothetical protein
MVGMNRLNLCETFPQAPDYLRESPMMSLMTSPMMSLTLSSLDVILGAKRMNSETGSIVLTYAEIAQRLGIKPASAKRLAQRRKWARIVGNDGIARVHVPLSAVPGDVPDDISGDVLDDVTPAVSSPVAPDLSSHTAYLDGIIEGLRGQLEAEQQRAEAEQRRADAAESRVRDIAADRDAWRQQAQRSLWSRLFGSP